MKMDQAILDQGSPLVLKTTAAILDQRFFLLLHTKLLTTLVELRLKNDSKVPLRSSGTCSHPICSSLVSSCFTKGLLNQLLFFASSSTGKE